MAYYEKKNSDLRLKLMSQLVVENHPIYSESPFREVVLERPADFNMEHLVEQMMALNSNNAYVFVDGVHHDNSDMSDTKTGTLHANSKQSIAEISNVRSSFGVLKSGAIRAVVLNPILNKFHFLFIPTDAINKLMHTKKGTPTKSRSIWLSYNKKKNMFTKLEKYGIVEFQTFKELAMEI
jgi:hypothetical protein